MEITRKHDTKIQDNGQVVAVIGSGIVGKSWAIIFSRSGYRVRLYDNVPSALTTVIPTIKEMAQKLHKVRFSS